MPREPGASSSGVPGEDEDLRKVVAALRADLDRALRNTEHLELLQLVTALVNEEQCFESALRSALPAICRSLGFAVGHVFLSSEDGAGLHSSDIWYLDDEIEGLGTFRRATEGGHWSPEVGLPGRVMESGRSEWVEDVKGDPEFYRVDESTDSPIRSGIGAPVMSGARTVALIEFYTPEPRPPDPELQKLLEQIGIQLGRVWEREEAAQQRRMSQERFRQITEGLDTGLFISGLDGGVHFASSGWEALTGTEVSADGELGNVGRYTDLVHPDDRDRIETLFADPDRAPYEVEYRLLVPDGEVRWIRQKAFPIRDERGRVYRIVGVADDVTGPRRARERLERILDSLAEGVVILDRDGRITYANEAASRLTSFSHSQLVGHSYDSPEWKLRRPEGTEVHPEELPPARVLRTGEPVWDELLVAEGFNGDEAVILSVSAVPMAPEEGEVSEVVVTFADVTERERMALELRKSEERFRMLAERIESVLWISSSAEADIQYISPAYADVWGWPPEELEEEPRKWLEHVHPDDRERVRRALECQAEGTFDIEFRVVRPDGEVRWVWDRAFPIRDDDGELVRIVGIAEDVTGRKRAEEDLRRAEAHFRAIIEKSTDVIAIYGSDAVTRYVSSAIEDVLGYSPEEVVGSAFTALLHPEERAEMMGQFRDLIGRPGDTLLQTYRMVTRDGSIRHVESEAHNLLDEPAVEGLVVDMRDITERKKLESQLRQAQKMEAVGRLAGGIAHDFNNLLTVIRAQSDLLRLDVSPESSLVEEIDVIRDAADRAAQLTSQLLAFGREQVLRPKVVDPNRVLLDMKDLLSRVLGEQVEIRTELERDLPPIRVDPVQLEQVLVNLAVNARDAMPGGGSLRLETAYEELDRADVEALPGLQPGSYVRLTVSDTGIGMDEATRARIFEPFFSTKDEPEGTGLGLAVSYGIIKQSGGSIHVESEPGEGATFHVRFPPGRGTPEPAE